MKILSINPGSTSTKIALFEDLHSIFVKTLRHQAEDIAKFANIMEQYEFRKEIIVEFLFEQNIALKDIDAVVGRGGLLKPIEGGVYEVNETMLNDIKFNARADHASNLGAILAHEIADKIMQEHNKKVPSYIVDPVVVDELSDMARFSGHPEIERVSIFHALNQKAVARRYARENKLDYNKLNLIVAHLGGGISVGLHHQGRVIDVNNALNGDGPFSPERTGGLPAAALVDVCFSGKYNKSQMKKFITGKGGFVAYLGTNDAYEVEIRALQENDAKAKKVFDALIYQIIKEIGSVAPIVCGKIDAIILTGGIARAKYVCEEIEKHTKFISPNIKVYPGEDEMEALAEGIYYASKGEIPILEYK